MPILPFRPTRARAAAAAAATAAAALLAACGDDTDPFAPRATSETAQFSFVVFPLSGDPTLPAALDLAGQRAVRPAILGGTILNFDVAFDVDAQGRIVLFPPAQVATPPAGAPRTGFQTVTSSFDQTNIAPRGGYRFDSTAVVAVGQTVLVQATAATCSATYPLHAKLVVDSIGPATASGRRVYGRVRVNPNCGFRSLEPGLPDE